MAGLADDVKSDEDINESTGLDETIRRVKGMGYQIYAATTSEDKDEVMARYLASGARTICNKCSKPLHTDVGEIEVEYVDEEDLAQYELDENDALYHNQEPDHENEQQETHRSEIKDDNPSDHDENIDHQDDDVDDDDDNEYIEYNEDIENETPEESVITVVGIECCKCTDLEPGEQIGFAWPATYDKDEKTENFKRWAKWYQDQKLPLGAENEPIFDLQKFAKDFMDKDFVDILTRREDDLSSMMNEFLELTRDDEDTDEKMMECLGLDAIMFLCDLNIDCMDQIHFVMINNAFNGSDSNKYRLDDKELQLIFSFVSSVVRFMEITKIVNGEKTDDDEEENETKDDYLDDDLF